MGRAGCPQSVAEAAEGKRTATCVYCRQEKVLKDTVSCPSWGDVTELSLTRRGCGQQSLLVVAAGVRVAQREQKPRAGRGAAIRGDEGQPNLPPTASEDEAREVVTERGQLWPHSPSLENSVGEPGLRVSMRVW